MTVLSELFKLSERSKCSESQLKFVASEIEHDHTLQQLSHSGTPIIALRDFISQTFRIVDFISPTIKTVIKNVYVPSV